MIARENTVDLEDDPVLVEVMTCLRIGGGAMPVSGGGIDEQPWDFVHWTMKLHYEIDSYQEIKRKSNSQ